MEKSGFNKNDKQKNFNQIVGTLTELNDAAIYCSITITCGHETKRPVNLAVKKELFDKLSTIYKIGDFVCCHFFLVSRRKEGRKEEKKEDKWFTNACLINIEFSQ